MKINKRSAIAALLIGAILGSAVYENQDALRSAWVKLTLSNGEAKAIQLTNITNHLKVMYVTKSALPVGDVTRTVALSGGLEGFLPDAPMDSIENERVRQSMDRLRFNEKDNVIVNAEGAQLKVVSKNGTIALVRVN